MGSFLVSEEPPPPVVMRGDDGEPLHGWWPDPTQRHEARYFSRGAPTKLYRDGSGDEMVEGYDDISTYLSSLMETHVDESCEAGPSEQAQELPPETRIPNAEDELGGPFAKVWHGTGEPSLLSQSGHVARIDPEMAMPGEAGSLRNMECGHCGASLVAQDGSLSVDAMLQKPVGLHWRFVNQTAGSVALEMEIREDMRGPAGSLEDGVVASLAEVAGVSAIGFKVGLVATEHLGVSFLAPGWVGPIRATATAQLVGKQDGIADVRVVDTGNDDQLVAVATVTVQILGKG
jgi:uncharacterized protein (TIGR00369 family)